MLEFLIKLLTKFLYLIILISLADVFLSFEIILLSDEVIELKEEVKELSENLEHGSLLRLLNTVSNIADVEGVYEINYYSSNSKASFR
jgi:hypothetical protein